MEIQWWEPLFIMFTSGFIVFVLYKNNILSKYDILKWFFEYSMLLVLIGVIIHFVLAHYDEEVNAPKLINSNRHYATIIEINQTYVSFVDLNTKRYYKDQAFDIPCKIPNGLVGDTFIIQVDSYKDSKNKIQEVPVKIMSTFCKE